MEVPEDAKQLTPDKGLYKKVLKPGHKTRHSTVMSDVAVAVEYFIKSQQGTIDYTEPNEPSFWITGDKEYESQIYPFLVIGVRTMIDDEVAEFYFTRDYFLGDGKVCTRTGEIDNSTSFFARVHLIQSDPIYQEKEDLPVIVQTTKDKESEQRKKYAFFQLNKANQLLDQQQFGNARKEFNKADLAWTKQVDIYGIPEDFTDERVSMEEEKAKAYIKVQSLIGVAKTFKLNPENKSDKWKSYIQNALKIDPDNQELKAFLSEEPTIAASKEEFSKDSPQYWSQESISWDDRIKFAESNKVEGENFFKKKDYKSALKFYNKVPISLPLKQVGDDQDKKRAAYELTIVSKLNSMACYLEMKQYNNIEAIAQNTIGLIKRSGIVFDYYLLKAYYRLALAYINLLNVDKAQDCMEKIRPIQGSGVVIKDLEPKLEECKKIATRNEDFYYKKMTDGVKE